MKKTHQGSCHCGAVKFECALDLAQETSRCNCSMCGKSRFWKAIVKDEDFRLIEGEAALGDYQFGGHVIHHQFCRHCGVKVFGRGAVEGLGAFHAVNVMCLDDLSAKELAAAPIRYEDGANNAWDKAPEEWRYL